MYDEGAILGEYKNQDDNPTSLAIKILSVVGGVLATFAFLGFLLIAGLYDSSLGLLIVGGLLIIVAIVLNKYYNKLIIDTLSISTYIIGLSMLAFGLGNLEAGETIITFTVVIISLISLFISQNYIFSFISIITICGSLLALVVSKELYYLIHLYNILISIALTYCLLKESKIITSGKKLSVLYSPLRIGLIISMLFGLTTLINKNQIPLPIDFIWLSSIVLFLLVLYTVSIVIKTMSVTETKSKIIIYTLSIMVLIPTAFAPSILGALLIILLCFLVNYRTGFAIGIIAFIYFVSQYYYDLNFTLLTKSIMLFTSGIVFLVFYLFIKYIGPNEKI